MVTASIAAAFVISFAVFVITAVVDTGTKTNRNRTDAWLGALCKDMTVVFSQIRRIMADNV